MKLLNKQQILRGLAVGGSSIILAAAVTPLASAQSVAPAGQTTYQVNLTQSNKSNASGTATVTVNGSNATVTVRGTGFSANLTHAAHIHVGGQAVCPTPAADTDKDGFVSVKEAEPYVGPMKVSLTTSGDVSMSSMLAVDRMPKADSKGALTYNRTFTLPSGVTAADMQRASIDIHGVASLFNDRTKYDGDKKSDLDSKLAFEITAPAACGKLTSTPTGGAATGVGSISGIESPGLFIGAMTALAGAIVVAFIARKQFSAQK